MDCIGSMIIRRMWTPTSNAWTVRGTSFVLWTLVGLSAVYWGLKLGGPGRSANVPVPPPRTVPPSDPAAIARLLGSAPAALPAPGALVPSLASRFQLVGVVAGVHSGGGAALIAVDGRPAKSYRVGASVAEGMVLQSVRGRQAVLGPAVDGPATLTLQLPASRGVTAQVPIEAPR
jgi:general secretion pathway protein C